MRLMRRLQSLLQKLKQDQHLKVQVKSEDAIERNAEEEEADYEKINSNQNEQSLKNEVSDEQTKTAKPKKSAFGNKTKKKNFTLDPASKLLKCIMHESRKKVHENPAKKPVKLRTYKILFDNEEWTYIGEWQLGAPHGVGIATSPDGEQYNGGWRQGVRHGDGKYLWTDGNFYNGSWHDGDFNGVGRYEWINGDWYDGRWKNGVRHGIGTFHWNNGDEYTGDWVNGIRHGKGKIKWVDGAKYAGEWKHGVVDGLGKKRWANGTKYSGMWVQGKMNHYGVKVQEGARYEGGWLDGKTCGFGIKEWTDGTKYEGFWTDGEHDGHGIKHFENGSKFDGDWLRGKPHGRGMLFWDDGRCYDMNFDKGKLLTLNKFYTSQTKYANACLVNAVPFCDCVKRSLKFRLKIHNKMFSDDKYHLVHTRPPKKAAYVGRENLRGIIGAPPVDTVPNFTPS